MGLFRKKTTTTDRQTRGSMLGRNRAVYSYYQKRSDKSENPTRKAPAEYKKNSGIPQKRSILRNLPALLGCLVIIVSFMYMTTLKPRATIKIVDDKAPGAVLLKDADTYKHAAERILASSPLNRSKFSIDSNKVAHQLESEFPELSGVTVVVPIIGDSPTFVVKPISPSFVISSNDDTYVVNEFGVAVAHLDELSDASKLKLITVIDKSGVALEQNKAVLSGDQALFINTVIAQFKAHNVKVKNIVIPLSAYDLQVRIPGKNYYVRMNMQGDPKLQTGTFLAMKKRIDKGSITVNEYVDVRVEERVYYK